MSPAHKRPQGRKKSSSQPAKKAAARKTTSKKTASGKAASKKSVGRKKTTRRATSAKTSARKQAGKTASGRKKPAARKGSSKSTSKKTPAAGRSPKKTARKTSRKTGSKKPARKPAAPRASSHPAGRAKPHQFDRDALERIRAKLRGELDGLERQQAELEDSSFDSGQADMAGEIGIDEDYADAGTATFDRERDFSIRNNISDLIGQVTRALEKIDEGTYGSCEHCGRPINAARLQALPHALLCMDCKRRDERAR